MGEYSKLRQLSDSFSHDVCGWALPITGGGGSVLKGDETEALPSYWECKTPEGGSVQVLSLEPPKSSLSPGAAFPSQNGVGLATMVLQEMSLAEESRPTTATSAELSGIRTPNTVLNSTSSNDEHAAVELLSDTMTARHPGEERFTCEFTSSTRHNKRVSADVSVLPTPTISGKALLRSLAATSSSRRAGAVTSHGKRTGSGKPFGDWSADLKDSWDNSPPFGNRSPQPHTIRRRPHTAYENGSVTHNHLLVTPGSCVYSHTSSVSGLHVRNASHILSLTPPSSAPFTHSDPAFTLRLEAMASVSRAILRRALPWQAQMCPRAAQDADNARVNVFLAREAGQSAHHRQHQEEVIGGLLKREDLIGQEFAASEGEELLKHKNIVGIMVEKFTRVAGALVEDVGESEASRLSLAAAEDRLQAILCEATIFYRVHEMNAMYLHECMWDPSSHAVQEIERVWEKVAANRASVTVYRQKRTVMEDNFAWLREQGDTARIGKLSEDTKTALMEVFDSEMGRMSEKHRERSGRLRDHFAETGAKLSLADDLERKRATESWRVSTWLGLGSHHYISSMIYSLVGTRTAQEEMRGLLWEAKRAAEHSRATTRALQRARTDELATAARARAGCRVSLRTEKSSLLEKERHRVELVARASRRWVEEQYVVLSDTRQQCVVELVRGAEVRTAQLMADRERESVIWGLLCEEDARRRRVIACCAYEIGHLVQARMSDEAEAAFTEGGQTLRVWQKESHAVAKLESERENILSAQRKHTQDIAAQLDNEDVESAVSFLQIELVRVTDVEVEGSRHFTERVKTCTAESADGIVTRLQSVWRNESTATTSSVTSCWDSALQVTHHFHTDHFNSLTRIWDEEQERVNLQAKNRALEVEKIFATLELEAVDAERSAVERWENFRAGEWQRIKSSASSGDVGAERFEELLKEKVEFWLKDEESLTSAVLDSVNVQYGTETLLQLEVEAEEIDASS